MLPAPGRSNRFSSRLKMILKSRPRVMADGKEKLLEWLLASSWSWWLFLAHGTAN